jgi:4-carboxymuconolactone decarboxylase
MHLAIAAGITDERYCLMDKRFKQLTLEGLTPEQRPLGEGIMKVSSIGLHGPYNPLLRSPKLGQLMYDLLYYLRWNSSLPNRLTEMAILIIGRLWTSNVEWYAHEPIARKAGLSEDIIAALKANKRPTNMQPDEAALYDFVTELYTKHKVNDATFANAKAQFTEQQIVDLTATAGTYVTIAGLLAMAEEPVPAGKAAPFGP